MAGLDHETREQLEGFLEDPKLSIPVIVDAMETIASFQSMTPEEIEEISPEGTSNTVLFDFIAKHNQAGLTQEQISKQVKAMTELTSMDDGVSSPNEILGSVVIMGGIVGDDTAVSGQSVEFATSLLEAMGMSDQGDTLASTIAFYVDRAKEDVQEFLKANPPPIEPSPESLTPEGQWNETSADITGEAEKNSNPQSDLTSTPDTKIINTSI